MDIVKQRALSVLKIVAASILKLAFNIGRWIAKWIGVMALVVFFAAMLMPKPKSIQPESTLYINLDRPLAEWAPFDAAPTLQMAINTPLLSAATISDAIRNAAGNARISRVVLDLDGMAGTGFGPINRVAAAIAEARAAGKTVVVYASNYDYGQYQLALNADKILMHPMGRFGAGGLRSGGLYFGEALEAAGVDLIVGQAGEYKSAIEPFTRRDMSAEARSALEDVLKAQQSTLLDRVEALRPGVARSALAALSRPTGSLSDAERAEKGGLIDEVLHPPAFMDLAFGKPLQESAPHYVTLREFLRAPASNRCRAALKEANGHELARKKRIGLLTLEGEIGLGAGVADGIGAGTAVARIEAFARDFDNVALVVRINSPGGDAQASEMIRSTLARYASLGRPVIVSMGSVAASGAYWIATAADMIFAEDTTITGSIGVFSLRPSATKALERLGVHWDSASVGVQNGFGAWSEPFSEGEHAALQGDADRVYEMFLQLVADARDVNHDAPETWAEGRIWHASDAIERGLVDRIGSIDAAMAFAADATDTPVDCVSRAAGARSTDSLLSLFSGTGGILARELAPLERILDTETGRVQAYCVACDFR